MVFLPQPRLVRRQTDNNFNDNCYTNQFGNTDCSNSAWNSWIRWVVAAAVLAFFLLLFMACTCFSARRRRRNGLQPFYGTGWAANRYPPHNQYAPRQEWQNPAPPYSHNPPPNYETNSNAGYFGGQQEGIELGQPERVYQPAYTPPVGPPPGKKGDTIIR